MLSSFTRRRSSFFESALRNADSKNELRLRVKLESKREMKNPEGEGQSLQIVEEEEGQVF